MCLFYYCMQMPTCTPVLFTVVLVILVPFVWTQEIEINDLCLLPSTFYPDSFEYEPTILSIPDGSLIIPMDSSQSETLSGNSVKFNMYVYGAIAALRRAHVPVEWVIKKHEQNETGDEKTADLIALVSRILPTESVIPAQNVRFYDGPFVVQARYKDLAINVLTNLPAIAGQTVPGWSILVYVTVTPTTAPIRYHIDTRVNLAVSSSMGFSGIVENYLRFSGFVRGEDYDVMEFSESMVNETTCYSTLVEPYSNDKDYYTNTFYNQLTAFLKSGGNVIASSTAAIHYESQLKLITKDGLLSYNSTEYSLDYIFDQPQSPISQLNSTDIANTSPVNTFFTTSTFNKLSYELIKNSDNNYKALGGRIETQDEIFYGCNLYYLAGNNYNSSGYEISQLNGVRMFLNAIMIPASRPQIPECRKSLTYEADISVDVKQKGRNPEKNFDSNYSVSITCGACFHDCYGVVATVAFPNARINVIDGDGNCSITNSTVKCKFDIIPSSITITKNLRIIPTTYYNTAKAVSAKVILANFVTEANTANNQKDIPYVMSNSPPVARNDFTNVTEDCSGKKVYYMENDSDVNNDKLTLHNITIGCGFGQDERGLYIMYTGISTCEYRITDGFAVSNMSTVIFSEISPDDIQTPSPQSDFFIIEPVQKCFDLLLNDKFTCIDNVTPINTNSVDLGDSSSTFEGKLFCYKPKTEVKYGDDFMQYQIVEGGKASIWATASFVVVPPIRITTKLSYTIDEDSVLEANIIDSANEVESRYFRLEYCEEFSDFNIGSVVCDKPAGRITYTPQPNKYGNDVVRFTMSNGVNALNGTFSVTILPVDDPTVAVNDYYVIYEDTVLNFNLTEWVSNDIDLDDVDDVVLVRGNGSPSNPTHGVIMNMSPLQYSYTPSLDYHGVDQFSYIVASGDTIAVGTVFITILSVHDSLRAYDDEVTGIIEDYGVFDIEVLLNDYVKDSNKIVIATNLPPENGIIRGDKIQYKASPNVNGIVSFTYTIIEPDVDSVPNVATVTINITAVNDAPTVSNFPLFFLEGEGEQIISIANNVTDVDVEQGPPTLHSVRCDPSVPIECRITKLNDIQFIPSLHFYGITTIEYDVIDVEGAVSSTGRISVTVINSEDLPEAEDDVIFMLPDTIVQIFPLINDNDYDDQDVLTIVSYEVGLHEGVNITELFTLHDSSYFTFNATQLDESDQPIQLSYTIQSDLDNAVANIFITISSNIDYINDSRTIFEDIPVEFDIDPYYSIILSLNAQIQFQPKHGIITFKDEDTYEYKPNINYNGDDWYTILIMDDNASIVKAFNISLDILPVDDDPVALGGSIEMPFPSMREFKVYPTVNDYNIDDQDGFVFFFVEIETCSDSNPAARCSFNVNDDNKQSVTIFIEGPEFQRGYSFTIVYMLKEINSERKSQQAEFTVTLTTNPPRVLKTEYEVSVMEDENVQIDIIGKNIVDDDSSKLILTQLGPPTRGVALIEVEDTNTTIFYTPNSNVNGEDVFGYIVSDGVNTVQGSIRVTIIPVNDPPVTPNFSIIVPQNSVFFMIRLPFNGVYDPDMSDVLVYSIVKPPNEGSANLIDTAIFYTPDQGFVGSDTIEYLVTDGLEQSIGTIFIEVVSQMGTLTLSPSPTALISQGISQTQARTITQSRFVSGSSMVSVVPESFSPSPAQSRSQAMPTTAVSNSPATTVITPSTLFITIPPSTSSSLSSSPSSSPVSSTSNNPSSTSMPGLILPPLPLDTPSTGFVNSVVPIPTARSDPSSSRSSQLLSTPSPSVSRIVYVNSDNLVGEVVILPGDPLASSLIKTRRLTDVVNIMLIDSDGNEIQPKRAEICFSNTGISDSDIKDSCLSSFNEKKGKWQCDDPCLNNKQDRVCGTVEHFTNFAILLRGGGSDKNDPCSSYPYILGSSEYDMALILSCVGVILIIGIVFIILTMFVKPVQSFVYGNETQRVRKLRNLAAQLSPQVDD